MEKNQELKLKVKIRIFQKNRPFKNPKDKEIYAKIPRKK